MAQELTESLRKFAQRIQSQVSSLRQGFREDIQAAHQIWNSLPATPAGGFEMGRAEEKVAVGEAVHRFVTKRGSRRDRAPERERRHDGDDRDGVCAFCQRERHGPVWDHVVAINLLRLPWIGNRNGPIPHVPCRYCEGTGSHKTFSCTVCRGREWSPRWLSQSAAAPAVKGGPMKSQAAWRVWNVGAEEWFPLGSVC